MKTLRRLASRWAPRTVWDVAVLLLAVASLMLLVGPVRELDSYWHVRLGGWFVETGNFSGDPGWTWGPHIDSWVSTQPASEVLMYLMWRVGGWPAIAAMRLILGLVLFSIVAMVARRAIPADLRDSVTVSRLRALLALILFICVPLIQERPQTLTFLFLVPVGLWLARLLDTGHWPSWWALPMIIWAWSLVHGGALLAVGALGLAACARILVAADRRDEMRRHLKSGALPVALAVIAPMLSPAGLHYYPTVLAISRAGSAFISEWTAPALVDSLLWPLLMMLSVFTACWWKILTAGVRGQERQALLAEIITVLGLVWFGGSLARNVLPAALLLVALSSRSVLRAFGPGKLQHWESTAGLKIYQWVLLWITVAGTALSTLPAAASAAPVDASKYPTAVFSGLAHSEGIRYVFNDYNLGGMLHTQTRPEVLPSLDGRSDRYGEKIVDDVDTVGEMTTGWQGVYNQWAQATDAIIESKLPFVDHLVESGDWYLNCIDGKYAWLVRTDMIYQTPACISPLPSESSDRK